MMGRSVSLRTSGIITVWTLPPRLRMPKTGNLAGCAASASAFANPAKIAFVHLDKPFDRQTILQLPSDDLTQPMKEIGGRLAVDARQIRRAPRDHPSDKKIRQSILRSFPSDDSHLSACSDPRSATDLGQPQIFSLSWVHSKNPRLPVSAGPGPNRPRLSAGPRPAAIGPSGQGRRRPSNDQSYSRRLEQPSRTEQKS